MCAYAHSWVVDARRWPVAAGDGHDRRSMICGDTYDVSSAQGPAVKIGLGHGHVRLR